MPNQRLPVRPYALANAGSWRAGFSESVMIANTRVVTLDVLLSALSRQSVRLVHENPSRLSRLNGLRGPGQVEC